MNAHCSIQLHWVLGKHEHAARLLVPTTVLSPFPPLSGWRKCVAYATSISVIHPSLYGWRLFISTLSGWRWFISTLSGWRWFISTLSGWRWFISTLQGWRMFISTLLGWRICLAYATPGSSQGYTGISVYLAMASPHVSNTPMNRCPSGLHASFLSVPQLTTITVSCQSEGLSQQKCRRRRNVFEQNFLFVAHFVSGKPVCPALHNIKMQVSSKKSFTLLKFGLLNLSSKFALRRTPIQKPKSTR